MDNNNPLVEKSDKLAYSIYRISKGFPKEELYGLTSQLRRASLSIPLNIIEGFARKGSKDCRRFLYVAYGSLKETKYLLFFAHREKYISKSQYQDILGLSEEVGKILWTSLKTIEKRIG